MKIKNLSISNKVIRNCLYVLGVILFIYYLYLLVDTCLYLGDLIKINEIKLLDDFGKVIQYIMTKTMSYLFYSIVILSFGKLISLNNQGNQEKIGDSEDK